MIAREANMATQHPSLRHATEVARRPAITPAVQSVSASGRRAMSIAGSLQERIGNRGTHALAGQLVTRSSAPAIARAPSAGSRPLLLSRPGDAHEREADVVADKVMRMTQPGATTPSLSRSAIASAPVVQRLCAECEEEKAHDLAHSGVAATNASHAQRQEASQAAPSVTNEVSANIGALRGGGSPMPAAARGFFERRFGADFSGVRLHTDARAADTAKAIHAKAFTVGHDIAFNAGQYAPASPDGQHLLAHELTHVVQQQGDEIQRAPEDTLDDLGKDLENLGKGLVKEAEERVRQELRALGALPGTGALFTKSGCPKKFCDPFADVSLAKTNLLLTAPVLLAGIAKVVSPRVVPLWKDYLFGGSGPQNLTSSFGSDFTASKTTEDTANFIRAQLRIEIAANHKAILKGTGPVTVDLTPRMPKTLAAIDNQNHPHAMDFNKIGEIAGNIAGGIGKDQLGHKIGAKPSPFNDDRTATITAELTRTATGIRVKPNIVFKIHDTIDLCPGNCGAITEQDATIPLSRFEATGLSGDVPFEIEFPAPASSVTAFDIPIAGPSPFKPKGGGKPKGASKGTPSKSGAGKTSVQSEIEPAKEVLVLEESEKMAGSMDEPGFIAGVEFG
jgi:hypothetical protein